MLGFIDKVKKRFKGKVKIGINPSFETEKVEVQICPKYNITINQFGDKTDPKKILESFEKEQIVTRDDLLLPDIEQTETVITRSRLLRFYRPYLSKKDLAALNDSLSIIALEDKELNKEAKERHRQLGKAFKERGLAIYNFARSGLFETEIKERLEKIIKEKKGKIIKAMDEFNNYFEGLIQRHPTNIYVSKYWNESKLLDEIQKRLELILKNEIGLIKIYCRKPQLGIVETVCSKINNLFSIEHEEYHFGKNKAYTIYLNLKEEAI